MSHAKPCILTAHYACINASENIHGFIGREPVIEMKRSGIEITAWRNEPGREPVIEMKRSGIEITAWRNEPGREPVTRMERGGTRIRAWRKATNI